MNYLLFSLINILICIVSSTVLFDHWHLNKKPVDKGCLMFNKTYKLGESWPDPNVCKVYQCRLIAFRLARNRLFHMPYELLCANTTLWQQYNDNDCIRIPEGDGAYPACCPAVACVNYNNSHEIEVIKTKKPIFTDYKPDFNKFESDYYAYVKEILQTLGGYLDVYRHA